MKIGILPLGRPTFDVPFAREKLAAMLRALDRDRALASRRARGIDATP